MWLRWSLFPAEPFSLGHIYTVLLPLPTIVSVGELMEIIIIFFGQRITHRRSDDYHKLSKWFLVSVIDVDSVYYFIMGPSHRLYPPPLQPTKAIKMCESYKRPMCSLGQCPNGRTSFISISSTKNRTANTRSISCELQNCREEDTHTSASQIAIE